MRRFPRTTPWWVEQAYRDRQTWQRHVEAGRVFSNVEDRGVSDLLALVTFFVLWRELRSRASAAMRNRYPKEGKGSRKAEHHAKGIEEGYEYAARLLLKQHALMWWRHSSTYPRRPNSHSIDEGGNRAYWDTGAQKTAHAVEEALGHVGWVFALQKLLGGKPGEGVSYTADEEE